MNPDPIALGYTYTVKVTWKGFPWRPVSFHHPLLLVSGRHGWSRRLPSTAAREVVSSELTACFTRAA